ncbi:efflux RND transporter permease subunit [Starkeya sp. ORNL1]|uniref:efflux RND transporter permease subunit n=1 Tax=Starkeya sp. ORNL1 TaxID=2709380 RepID=UPI0019811908|nr:efflux RND transporter permease subunit [Starkeya sp. ORNL1]
MTGLARLFAGRPVGSMLIAIGIMLIGAAAYRQLAIATLPAIDVPTIVVSAQLPGASPETMASAVATPLERRLGRIASITELTSINTLGNTQITLQFAPERNVDGAAVDVQAAISAAGDELPKDMPSRPVFKKINPILIPAVFLSIRCDTLPPDEVIKYVNGVIVDKLAQLEGVGNVVVQGAAKAAVRVRMNPAAMASVGIGLDDVRAAIVAGSVTLPTGSLDNDYRSEAIVTDSQLTNAAAFSRLIVAQHDGANVRLGDIGTVADSVVDTRVGGWLNTDPAIFVYIQRKAGANIVATVDRVREALPQIRRWLPPSIHVDIIADRTVTIRGTLHDAQLTFLATTLLVIGTILLFLRDTRATLIAGMSIPVALAGTFIVMYFLDYSLDLISLTALTVAIAFVIDDSIVMVENIARFREQGFGRLEATVKGAAQIGFTIVAITLSLVAAFIPFLMFPGVIGVIMREFSVTLCVSILISAVVSLTLTPALAARFLKVRHADDSEPREGRLGRWIQWGFDRILDGYARSLRHALDHRRFMLFLTALCAVGTIALYAIMPSGFMPTQDTGVIIGITEAPPDTSFAAMRLRQIAVAKAIREHPAVENVTSSIGTTSVDTGGGAASVSTGRFYIMLKPRSERGAVTEIIDELREALSALPSTRTYLQPVEDLNVGAREGKGQYQFTLQDENWEELDHWFDILFTRFRTLPELRDVGADLQNGGLQVILDIDRDRAAQLGISPQVIDDTLYSAFGQRRVSTIYATTDQYYVVLEVDANLQAEIDTLQSVYVKAPDGSQIPLRAVTKTSEGETALVIPHQGEFPSITISFNLAPGVALNQAIAKIEDTVAELRPPGTLRTSFEGKAGAFNSSSGSEPYLLLAAIFTIYIVLGVLYESYVHPFTILSTIPSAGLGALLALLLSGQQLSLIAFIGIILLVGIVKKNAILMIDFALSAERSEGLSSADAIYKACVLRFRPIVMTNLAAIVGALPLALGTGPGYEIRQPLGYAIIGGLMVSGVLNLYTTPVIYLYMDWFRRRRARKTEPAQDTLATEAG